MDIQIVHGDLLDQDVEVIVNPWNQNFIPWFLLLPQGVSRAIKKQAGYQPFNQIMCKGPMRLGTAHQTDAGRLNFKAIIHVAGINFLWFATQYSIEKSIESAMEIARLNQYKSIAFSLIGAGSGNRGLNFSKDTMLNKFQCMESDILVKLVIFKQS